MKDNSHEIRYSVCIHSDKSKLEMSDEEKQNYIFDDCLGTAKTLKEAEDLVPKIINEHFSNRYKPMIVNIFKEEDKSELIKSMEFAANISEEDYWDKECEKYGKKDENSKQKEEIAMNNSPKLIPDAYYWIQTYDDEWVVAQYCDEKFWQTGDERPFELKEDVKEIGDQIV